MLKFSVALGILGPASSFLTSSCLRLHFPVSLARGLHPAVLIVFVYSCLCYPFWEGPWADHSLCLQGSRAVCAAPSVVVTGGSLPELQQINNLIHNHSATLLTQVSVLMPGILHVTRKKMARRSAQSSAHKNIIIQLFVNSYLCILGYVGA